MGAYWFQQRTPFLVLVMVFFLNSTPFSVLFGALFVACLLWRHRRVVEMASRFPPLGVT
jgi:hypothetical protein